MPYFSKFIKHCGVYCRYFGNKILAVLCRLSKFANKFNYSYPNLFLSIKSFLFCNTQEAYGVPGKFENKQMKIRLLRPSKTFSLNITRTYSKPNARTSSWNTHSQEYERNRSMPLNELLMTVPNISKRKRSKLKPLGQAL